MMIALIICISNQNWLLPLILECVAAQICSVPFEVIICDDGSVDNPLETITAWSHISKITTRYIWQPNIGVSQVTRSRNNGILATTAQLLVFIDGDICIPPTFLETHLTMHAGHPVIACGGRKTINVRPDADLASLRQHLRLDSSPHERREWDEQLAWISTNRPWMACIGANFSFRGGDHLLFDENIYGWGSDDRDLSIRAFQNGLRPACLPDINSIHFVQEGYSRFPTSKHVVELLKSKQYLRKKYPAGEMTSSIDLVRYCAYNFAEDSWYFQDQRDQRTADQILDQFSSWQSAKSEQ